MLIFFFPDVVDDQEVLWTETVDDDPSTEADARQGEPTPVEINPRLLHDIQVALSRLIGKARQLVTNETTNLAESWMHIRMKLDGGKVIHRSQSGSSEHRCMGAGLRQNLGKAWGSLAWQQMTHYPPNEVFVDSAKHSAKRLCADKK